MDAADCFYCLKKILSENFLTCNQCFKSFHIECLKRPGTPGDLHGDVFFEFTCIRCSPLEEIFVRKKIPWLIVLVLAIYNLSIQSQGLSHNGYFHWRSHISTFIDKNWKYLFDANTKQRKKWFGTLSGTLSSYSPDFFESGGSKNLTESGWWKLSSKNTPQYFMKLFENMPKKQNRHQAQNSKTESFKEVAEQAAEESSAIVKQEKEPKQSSENDNNDDYICSRFLPYMGRKRKRNFSEHSAKSENSVKLNLINFLEENISSHDSLLANPIISPTPYEDFNFQSNLEPAPLWPDNETEGSNDLPPTDEPSFQPRIIQVTNFQISESDLKSAHVPVDNSTDLSSSESNHSEESNDGVVVECEKSLFTKGPPRPLPWLKSHPILPNELQNDLQNLSEYEERKLYMALRKVINTEKSSHAEKIPTKIRLLYRKLSLRIMKRQKGLKPFDLDDYVESETHKEQKPNILDRYCCFISDSLIHSISNHKATFVAQISGCSEYELFESPFTSRILMPFIYRNSTYFPNWLKLMCEIQHTKLDDSKSKVERSTIDFCYVRPYHIAGVNSLLQQVFWPGIDMSECLSYPDFSVVALYKKLIVGCAFMVPDVSYNEAYISYMAVRPHWQHSGIASFMLYHLTQTCMGKDITLHVSATNPAICLYQKFGFKIEELVLDFYEKYLPIESSQSRHAFFLRLRR